MLAGRGKAFGLFQVTQQMLCGRGEHMHGGAEAAGGVPTSSPPAPRSVCLVLTHLLTVCPLIGKLTIATALANKSIFTAPDMTAI